MLQRIAEWGFRYLTRGFHLLKIRRFINIFSDPQAEQYQYRAQQERDPPAPGEKILFTEQGHQRNNKGRHQHADGHARLRNAAEEPFAFFWRVFIGQQQRAAPFTADAHPLNDTHQDQQRGSPHANHLIRRQQANHDGCTAHQREGQDKGLFTSDAVTDMCKKYPANGANKKG